MNIHLNQCVSLNNTDYDKCLEEVLSDPAASFWIKDALRSSRHRDAVDCLLDAEKLVEVFRNRCDVLLIASGGAMAFFTEPQVKEGGS